MLNRVSQNNIIVTLKYAKPSIRIQRNENGSLGVKTGGFRYLPISQIGITKDGRIQVTFTHSLDKAGNDFVNAYLKAKFIKPPVATTQVTTNTTETDSETVESEPTNDEPVTPTAKPTIPTNAQILVALKSAKLKPTPQNLKAIQELTSSGEVSLEDAITAISP